MPRLENYNKNDMKRTVNELILILPCIDNFETWADSLPYPETVAGHAVTQPDALTLGQYLDLSNINPDSLIFETARILMPYKLPDEVIGCFDSSEIIGLVWGIKKAVEQLNAAFQSLSPELSNEEKAAGVPEFGCMGLVDFASKRFGKTYGEAMQLNAWEVYQAFQIEHETAEYKKRLQTIYQNKR